MTSHQQWTVGQLHPSLRLKGCEHLYTIFAPTDNPNVKVTVAENLTQQDAEYILKAIQFYEDESH